MSVCTAPNCGQPAVLQWQRTPDQAEADAHVRAGQDTQGNIHGHQHAIATRHVVALRAELDQAATRAANKDVEAARVVPAIHAQLAAAETHMKDLETNGPAVVVIDVATVAVFGCATHAISVDNATWTHQPGCLASGACRCIQPK